jgi:type IV pilus assembly protein PilV
MLSGEKIMYIQNLSSVKSNQQGVVIIEALIAILIFSMGILALVGLQATMLQNTTASKFRSDASYIAQQRIGRMWADPGNAAAYVITNDDISALLPGGKVTITQTAAPTQFQINVGWTAPGETALTALTSPCAMAVAHCFTTTASIAGG